MPPWTSLSTLDRRIRRSSGTGGTTIPSASTYMVIPTEIVLNECQCQRQRQRHCQRRHSPLVFSRRHCIQPILSFVAGGFALMRLKPESNARMPMLYWGFFCLSKFQGVADIVPLPIPIPMPVPLLRGRTSVFVPNVQGQMHNLHKCSNAPIPKCSNPQMHKKSSNFPKAQLLKCSNELYK